MDKWTFYQSKSGPFSLRYDEGSMIEAQWNKILMQKKSQEVENVHSV